MFKDRDFKTLFGLRLAKLRKIKRFSQEVFAEKIGIAQRTLSCIETGVNFTQSETIERILEVLGVSSKELFDFNDEYTSKEMLSSVISKIKLIRNDAEKLKLVDEFLEKIS